MTHAAVSRIGFRLVPVEPHLRITIDDRDLSELVPTRAGNSTVFTRVWKTEVTEGCRAVFLGSVPADSRLEADQIELSGCPQCGDVECGAVVARLRTTDTGVV